MAFLGLFWYWFKTFIWKKYSKSKQTKYLGFVKLGVRWGEPDIWFQVPKNVTENKKCPPPETYSRNSMMAHRCNTDGDCGYALKCVSFSWFSEPEL